MAWNEPGGNGKDPWGHRNNDQGPPDLDELVKKMQDKLGGLFGGSGQGGSGSGNSGMPELNPKIIGFILLGLFVIWLLFGFYTVQPAYKGIELRFGKFTTVTDQGLNWHIPYPIESVVKINVEEIRAVPHEALMLTQDENIVEIALVAQYQIQNAEHYLFNVKDPDNTLRQATESALREVVGMSKMDEVLTSGRDKMAHDTRVLAQDILDRYATGLIVRSINMQNAQPPDQVQAAFADAIKAREDEERLKNKAEAYRNEVTQKAGGIADQIVQGAEAYRSQVVEKANGESRRFLSVLQAYQVAPQITRKRLYLETMETVLAQTSKVMIDIKQGNPLLFLPLDKMMAQNLLPEQPESLSDLDIFMRPSTNPNEDNNHRPSRIDGDTNSRRTR